MSDPPEAALPAVSRNRALNEAPAARLEKFERERLIVECLCHGLPVAEIAAQLDVSEKRMRAIIREILASCMPGGRGERARRSGCRRTPPFRPFRP